MSNGTEHNLSPSAARTFIRGARGKTCYLAVSQRSSLPNPIIAPESNARFAVAVSALVKVSKVDAVDYVKEAYEDERMLVRIWEGDECIVVGSRCSKG